MYVYECIYMCVHMCLCGHTYVLFMILNRRLIVDHLQKKSLKPTILIYLGHLPRNLA